MYDNVFRRIEQKYILSNEQKISLLKKIKNQICEDKYFKSKICNIYFDSDNNDLIINSLEKPIFKEKIRLRSYGIPTYESSVFLEIKEKYKGIVGKRRIKMKLNEFYEYFDSDIHNDSQIMREIDFYFRKYSLKPKTFVAYDRESYMGLDDSNLRITFDSNLRSREDNLRLEFGDKGDKFFDNNECIMEIKVLDSMPLWLARSLSELKIYPSSFSKVGKIYSKERSEILC